MAVNFPNSPSNGDSFTSSGISFTYNSTDGTWASSISGTNGITEIDQWRLTADLPSDADPVSSNLSRVDDASFSKLGTGMSVSSGVWSFPGTGLWKVSMNVSCYFTVADLAIRCIIQISSDSGANWDNTADFKCGETEYRSFGHGAGEAFVNVTNVSTIKLRFSFTSISSGNEIIGESGRSTTYFSFMRLGDSQ